MKDYFFGILLIGLLVLIGIILGRNLEFSDKSVNFLSFSLYTIFSITSFYYFYNIFRINKYFKKLNFFKIKIIDLEKLVNNRNLPQIAIFVPARNEGDVIENTIKNLTELDYPKQNYRVFIITDERELDDNVKRFTKDIVNEYSMKFNKQYGVNFIQCIEVPKWYSGKFNDLSKAYEKSTKGRALNYALQYIHNLHDYKDIKIVGVLDADGRLNKDVLKEVAYKRIKFNSKILQGPVFQITNFSQSSIIGIVAGLELAIHHMTELADNLFNNKIQFLAGTNYFICKNLIIDMEGWNQYALVEDAELALKIFSLKKIKAEWLSCPEVEQTPPSYLIYRKQRERWARGHFSLIKGIMKSNIYLFDKINLFFNIVISQFRFFIDFSFLIISVMFIVKGIFKDFGILFNLFSLLLFILSIFIWDMYGFMYRKLSYYINPNMKQSNKILQSLKLILSVPRLMFIQAIPRVEALINCIFKFNRGIWYKTERTKELTVD